MVKMSSWVGIEGGKVRQCSLCGSECENVIRMLWECSVCMVLELAYEEASVAVRR